MKIRGWRKPTPALAEPAAIETDLSPRREDPRFARARRAREGQDIEMEQFLAQLRNNHF